MEKFLFLNFKTYSQSSGKNALKLAKIAQSVSGSANARIVLVVGAVDARLVSESVSLDVFGQHADPFVPGAHTGFVLPFALKGAGCKGVVLNHAENKRSDDFLRGALSISKDAGLNVLFCAESLKRAVSLASFGPAFIAVEPPELIGGNVSVSTANPELIGGAVKKINAVDKKIKVIAGAGIKTAQDVQSAVHYGAQGVFVASGVVLVSDQKKVLKDLLVGFE